MKDQKQEQRLLHALGEARDEYIADAAVQRPHGKLLAFRRRAVAVAAVLALVIAVGLLSFHFGAQETGTLSGAAIATVTFDVNPSVELTLDRDERVLEANALNADGETVLSGLELVGTNLKTASSALIGAFLTNGYLNELQNAILVSVAGEDGDALQEELSASVSTLLTNGGLQGAVLSQSLTEDEAREALAEQYGISSGKAALIQVMTAQDASLTFEGLSPLTITELALIAENRGMDLSSLKTVGEASDEAYLGATAALEAACAAAGTTVDSVFSPEVSLDSEDGVICYRVRFCVEAADTGAVEYEFLLDAKDGTILSQEAEQCGHDAHEDADTSGLIGADAARDAALKDAGISAADTLYLNCWLEYDDGAPECYEAEFAVLTGSSTKRVYRYQIDCTTGTILSRRSSDQSHSDDADNDDDHDDDDHDDHDDHNDGDHDH